MSDAAERTGGLAGLKVVSFESRMPREMYALIANQGGQPLIVPALREVPLGEQPEALAFGRRWLAGEVDVLVLLTGVGTRRLIEILAAAHGRERIVAAFGTVTVAGRGPKVAQALREAGLKPDLTAAEPHTWREVLAVLAGTELAGRRVAVQEYGESNPELLAALAARGAEVIPVPVYGWALPEDPAPLQAGLREIAAGRADVVLFTSAAQIQNVVRLAQRDATWRAVRAGLARCALGSVGPTTTAELSALFLAPDFTPAHGKMGHLVLEAAAKAKDALAARRADVRAVAPAAPARGDLLHGSLFMKACRGEPVPRTPVWLMRQAGRYMKEYRLLRQEVGFLDLCRRPELAAEVTVAAAERIGADAAIIFSDLLVVTEPMGFPVAYTKGDGPVIRGPVRTAQDVDRLKDLDPVRDVPYVLDALRRCRADLPADLPLLGFAGAPFTLASYLIEGEGSRTFAKTKAFMYADPGAWDALLSRLAASLARYLGAQAAAGAQAVQLFDSWVGCLSPADYRRFVLPHTQAVFAALPRELPAIHFGTGTGQLLEAMREAGGTVIGLDWHVEFADARRRLGDTPVMGNLDPAALFAPEAELRAQVRRILDANAGRPGHVFNLGHGILPGTDPDKAIALIRMVKDLSAKPG